MRTTIYILLISCLIACSEQRNVDSPESLDEARGQWVLVNYWAEWCKPCIEEIPELNHFAQAREDVTVLGVNFEGTTGTELAEQEAKLGVDFPTIDDPSAALGIARPAVLPTTLIINPEGGYVDKLLGPQTEQTLASAIEAAQVSAKQ